MYGLIGKAGKFLPPFLYTKIEVGYFLDSSFAKSTNKRTP